MTQDSSSARSTISMDNVRELALEQGLMLRGSLRIEAGELIPAHASGYPHCLLLLFGQAGSSIWHSFTQSVEYTDSKPDPMDRWSHRIGCSLAVKMGGTAFFPFDGPPWHPFGQWAQRAESIRPSPLGILMHPQYGLWHAYRFAIALPALIEGYEALESLCSQRSGAGSACDACLKQPCLSSCPVNAFSKEGYDIQACAAYLKENEQSDCHQSGCQARNACPEGDSFRYETAHLKFHMQEFYRSLR